ncbi:hypothetical protein PHJA_000863400 [Phtheirospermum japonicum]|uniref:SHSP domain-containing protein n=1 Tax=Phtheirospermum japonicum TaxID=374723 RepID=A0A830BIH3_9LAMI|nr:hypothetical protein PHJA_000863400 [Phtheirospermum japonicum]
MDNLDPGKIKKITWKRSKTAPDVKNEGEHSNACKEGGEKRRRCDSLQLSAFTGPRNSSAQPFVLPLLPIPKIGELCSDTSTDFTGTACSARTGPPVGAVDIGVSKSSYYFCIALPGVKKDPGDFSCTIQRDGKVCVQGVTSTGGKIVKKYSRVFEMKIQQQCPPGPFRLFFSLPGPVDPSLFESTFRSDGIFEAIVAKYE